MNKSCQGSNSRWKNSITSQKIPADSEIRDTYDQELLRAKVFMKNALTLEPIGIFGHVIPFFHLKFDPLQLLFNKVPTASQNWNFSHFFE